MSEQAFTIAGPAMARHEQQFVMMVPFRKSTTGQFSVEAIETAVEIMLTDSLPAGVEMDRSKPIGKLWSDEPFKTPGKEDQVLVRISCHTKEKEA